MERRVQRGNKSRLATRGMCDVHYIRYMYGWDWDRLVNTPIGNRRGKGCHIDGCSSRIYGNGLCKEHYRQCELEVEIMRLERAVEIGELSHEAALACLQFRTNELDSIMENVCCIQGCTREACKESYHPADIDVGMRYE